MEQAIIRWKSPIISMHDTKVSEGKGVGEGKERKRERKTRDKTDFHSSP